MSEEEKRAINNMKLFARVHQDMTVVTAEERDIVLKLVERLQRENEKALAEYMKWQKQELEQKDKIIDLMAETINNHDIDEDICKQMGQKANCNEFEDTEKCKECLKQYFENKAKEMK